MAKFAIIKTGGKQYKVKEGDKLVIEKLDGKDGGKIDFKEVLFVADEAGKEVEIGKPMLKGKKVEATLEKTFKGDKITVIKYKAKVRYRRKLGHRQQQSLVKIGQIV
jgi:large subunit ribosomal protein L21